MSLTITIDRTEGGLYRAEVADHPPLVFEHPKLSGLIEELKRNLDALAVTGDGRLTLFMAKPASEAGDVAGRAEVERSALRNEELDKLIERHPVPQEWGNEPGWSDAL